MSDLDRAGQWTRHKEVMLMGGRGLEYHITRIDPIFLVQLIVSGCVFLTGEWVCPGSKCLSVSNEGRSLSKALRALCARCVKSRLFWTRFLC